MDDMARITRRAALAQPETTQPSRLERPEMPFELIRMVLERLPWDQNPWLDGKELHWQGFLALRRTSSRVKEEIESLRLSWVDKLALDGMVALMRACTSRDLPPAAIQHYALLERVGRARLYGRSSLTGIAPQYFRQVLELLPNLTHLDLGRADVDDAFFGGAALSPQSLPRLKSLSLGWSGITGASLPAIDRLLPALEELNLAPVELRHSDLGGLGIADALRLRRLDVRRCYIGQKGLNEIAVLLARTTALEDLQLDDDLTGPQGASVFGVALSVNRSLKILSVQRCRLSDEGVEALGLQRHKNIASLVLQSNNIVLCHGLDLSLMPSLVNLNLAWNTVTAEGITNLNLRHNTTLRMLNLRRNRMTDEACGMLGRQLATSALHSLCLLDCKISDTGLAALQLQSSHSLVEVDLSKNDISDNGVRLLRLRDNRVLRELSLCSDDGDNMRLISKAAAATVFSDPSQVVVLGTHLNRGVRVRGGMDIAQGSEIRNTTSD